MERGIKEERENRGERNSSAAHFSDASADYAKNLWQWQCNDTIYSVVFLLSNRTQDINGKNNNKNEYGKSLQKLYRN